MFNVKFAAGSTILLQNAQPTAEDCMYYVAEGQAEVVIMGTVDAASKQSEYPGATTHMTLTCSRGGSVVLQPSRDTGATETVEGPCYLSIQGTFCTEQCVCVLDRRC
jgi:hypothetical protein